MDNINICKTIKVGDWFRVLGHDGRETLRDVHLNHPYQAVADGWISNTIFTDTPVWFRDSDGCLLMVEPHWIIEKVDDACDEVGVPPCTLH